MWAMSLRCTNDAEGWAANRACNVTRDFCCHWKLFNRHASIVRCSAHDRDERQNAANLIPQIPVDPLSRQPSLGWCFDKDYTPLRDPARPLGGLGTFDQRCTLRRKTGHGTRGNQQRFRVQATLDGKLLPKVVRESLNCEGAGQLRHRHPRKRNYMCSIAHLQLCRVAGALTKVRNTVRVLMAAPAQIRQQLKRLRPSRCRPCRGKRGRLCDTRTRQSESDAASHQWRCPNTGRLPIVFGCPAAITTGHVRGHPTPPASTKPWRAAKQEARPATS